MWKLFRGSGLLLVLLLTGFAAMAQSGKSLKGKITDVKGQPIPGANVAVKGTSQGTASSATGEFTLTVPADAVLVISAMGFASQEVSVAGKNEINVSLEESSKGLDEVVVVGYGTQKKGDVTAAISTVNTKNLEKQPAGNIGTMLQGQAAGVIVSSGTGDPAASPKVMVRGLNSINNDNPLYVVDGIPQTFIYDVNPNDIESISVLKDASAATIYGARAAGA
ncbi:TonB-dependent receptor plug domain-containing protein [Chitinophaga pollutisoli]|uniref:TonB-dependent receptor plug domain-containing protein n=1 Tax=Chitinophaga pollutisoli TaxID=3133966 RepID=A0ABZ2YTY4_9BACT